MAAPIAAKLTAEQYLEMERHSDVRHEFWHGEIFAMAGGRANHDRICINLGGNFYPLIAGRACEIFTSNMKVGVTKKRGFAYPDFTIVCGHIKFYDDVKDVVMNPAVIFEVLSDSTRAADSFLKFNEYQKLESLRHYVLVEQDKMLVVHYQKSDGEKWIRETLERPEDQLVLSAVGMSITLEQIYRKVELVADAQELSA